ncbi:hypothetical protein CYMTET_21143, partial [Cymbomonas tetramitiformis]
LCSIRQSLEQDTLNILLLMTQAKLIVLHLPDKWQNMLKEVKWDYEANSSKPLDWVVAHIEDIYKVVLAEEDGAAKCDFPQTVLKAMMSKHCEMVGALQTEKYFVDLLGSVVMQQNSDNRAKHFGQFCSVIEPHLDQAALAFFLNMRSSLITSSVGASMPTDPQIGRIISLSRLQYVAGQSMEAVVGSELHLKFLREVEENCTAGKKNELGIPLQKLMAMVVQIYTECQERFKRHVKRLFEMMHPSKSNSNDDPKLIGLDVFKTAVNQIDSKVGDAVICRMFLSALGENKVIDASAFLQVIVDEGIRTIEASLNNSNASSTSSPGAPVRTRSQRNSVVSQSAPAFAEGVQNPFAHFKLDERLNAINTNLEKENKKVKDLKALFLMGCGNCGVSRDATHIVRDAVASLVDSLLVERNKVIVDLQKELLRVTNYSDEVNYLFEGGILIKG